MNDCSRSLCQFRATEQLKEKVYFTGRSSSHGTAKAPLIDIETNATKTGCVEGAGGMSQKMRNQGSPELAYPERSDFKKSLQVNQKGSGNIYSGGVD